MIKGSFLIIAAALLIVASMPSAVGAYGGATHEWVVLQAFDLFKCPGPEPCTTHCPQHYYPELELPYGNYPQPPYWPWWVSDNNLLTQKLVGGGAADDHSLVYDFGQPTGTHFWIADDPDEFHQTPMPFSGDYPNAMDEARRELKLARELYPTDKAAAYDALAHVIHHIADMTVPEHAHGMPHVLGGLNAEAGDSYDDWCGWVGDNDEDSDTFYKNHHYWTANEARAAGGFVVIPNDPQNGALAVYNSILQYPDYNDGQWPDNAQLAADFYYLIYTANQYGDYYGSMGFIPKYCAVCSTTGDGDGNTVDRHNWMNYGAPPFTNVDDPPLTQDRLLDNSKMLYCTPSNICPIPPWVPCPLNMPTCWQFWGSINDDDWDLTRIASTNLPYAYRAAATLIKSFRDSIDTVPPVTTIGLQGTAGHDGWYRSDVLMTLSATDELSPDKMMTQWRYAAETGYCWIDFAYSHTFYSEGIREINYRSIDGLGNEEIPLAAAIKIDKTDPVISITSPDRDGFYLTTDTLQIIFDVSDALSGVYSQVAKLDGNVVSNNQVFNLSAMGGWHTFTVEAEDYAGNKTFKSVTFSIKISATIKVNPVKINDKSNSDPLTTYIAFPAGYDVGQINVPKTTLSPKTGWLLMAATSPTSVNHGIVPDRMVKFNKQDFITAIAGATGNTNVIVQGELINKTEFYGTSTVLVTHPGK